MIRPASRTYRWRGGENLLSVGIQSREAYQSIVGWSIDMDFSLTPGQQEIREAILKVCAGFGDDYWLERDSDGEFPHAFHRAIADGGWLGIAMPEAYGGSGLGIAEAAVMMQAMAESGAAFSGASALHMNIFGLNPVVVFGTEEQKRALPAAADRGRARRPASPSPSPTPGSTPPSSRRAPCAKATATPSTARRFWISTAQVADRVLLLARTTPLEEVKKPTEGLSLFYTALDRAHVEARVIDKMGRKAVDSNQLFFDGLPVPLEDRIGEEGKGFQYILHGMNPERILIAAEAVGIGRAALARAARYARERIVFGRPIGQNQAIQHPLAKCWAELEAANLMMLKAAGLYDAGKPCGVEANAAKYLAAEAGFTACETAVMTHGGMGYAKEFHVERYLREVMIARIAPVSRELILSHIAEKALGLPKSY